MLRFLPPLDPSAGQLRACGPEAALPLLEVAVEGIAGFLPQCILINDDHLRFVAVCLDALAVAGAKFDVLVARRVELVALAVKLPMDSACGVFVHHVKGRCALRSRDFAAH
jgi:hypothetical protein